jgi:cell division protein ZapA
MPLVNVMVNNRAYAIACDDGEEDHLRQLAATVDAKTREVLSSVGQVGDVRLFLMAALLIADEHHGKPEPHPIAADMVPRAELEAHAEAAQHQASTVLDQAAARIEHLAAELSAA